MSRPSLNVNSHPLKRGSKMWRFCLLYLVACAATINSYPIRSEAQPASAVHQRDSISIHLALTKSSYAVGEHPVAVMAIKTISSNDICLSPDPYRFRVHVVSKDLEPPKTEFHRHLLGEFSPGDKLGLGTGPIVCRPIAAGGQDSEKFDLIAFYDLSKTGNYSVYIDIYDPAGPEDGSGHWLRTNTAEFVIVPLE
jgi:hypothetical protein